MTIPLLKIKVFPKPVLKGKMDVRFPANVATAQFLTVTRANGTYSFGVDYTRLAPGPISDPTTATVAVLDQTAGGYRQVSLAALLASSLQIEQHVTAAGPVAIGNNTGIVRVDQAIGAPITLTMGLASAKTCPVLISDWKGDAGTNNITINLTGGDKFPGGLTSWIIAADTGSVFLRPIAGVGYVL
jgi:hypothetical protein